MPPSAPERTSQASGQGRAIARLYGGLPCCSVPASTTRWAAKRRHAAAEETKKKEKRRKKKKAHTHTTLMRLLLW
jgi:hypothetical protein